MKNNHEQEIVLTPSLKNLVKRALSYLNTGYPIHLVGPAGAGKTELAFYIAKQLKRPIHFLQGNHEMRNEDFLGGITGYQFNKTIDNYIHSVFKHEEKAEEFWVNGPLLEAVKNGDTFIYDDFTRSKPETNNLFLSVLQERKLSLFGKKTKSKYIEVHKNFSVIFTSNPEEYIGVFQAQDALMDRIITLKLEPYKPDTEALILSKNTGLTITSSKKITSLFDYLRKNEQADPGLRAALMIAQIATSEKIIVDYDNQDFIMLCSDIIQSALYSRNKKENVNLLKAIAKHRRGGADE